MEVCKGIEKVEGGYIVTMPFPWGQYSDGGKVVCVDFADVIDLLRSAAHEHEEDKNHDQ